MRIDVAAVRPQGDEAVGVLQAQVPGARGAHRHAAQDDPVAVDVVIAADGLDRLEDVGLAGPAVAVLDAAQRMQLDVVLLGGGLAVVVAVVEAAHEAQLAHADRLAAAVQHHVEPDRLARVVLRRDDHAVGLHRAVHRGDEGADDLALLLGPRAACRLPAPRPARCRAPAPSSAAPGRPASAPRRSAAPRRRPWRRRPRRRGGLRLPPASGPATSPGERPPPSARARPGRAPRRRRSDRRRGGRGEWPASRPGAGASA